MSGSATPTFGVTPTGFISKRLLDCQADIVSTLNARLAVIVGDPTFQVDTRPDSVLGQLILTFAEREATLWETVAAIYNGMYPVTASGTSLDNSVTFAGVTRLQETQTSVWAALYGAEGTMVPYGSKAALSSTGESFSLASAVVISAASVIDVKISVVSVIPRANYSVIINNLSYGYIASTGDGTSNVIQGLAAALALSGYDVTNLGDAQVEITAEAHVAFSVSVSTNLNLDLIGSPGQFTSDDFGPVIASPGDLSMMTSTIQGWAALSNPTAGITGQYQETDAALRTRYQLGVYQFGCSILPAIQANLLNKVAGVTAVTVIPNNSNLTLASGQPANSVQCVVQGGDDLAVAQMIFSQVAAGIATWGTTSIEVDLAVGGAYIVSFTRPQPLYIWVRVQTFLLSEESFPANGLAAEAQAVLAAGQSLSVGDDVVVQRFMGPIYNSVSGIGGLTITVASNTDPGFAPQDTDFGSANIAVAATQIATFDISRIAVS